ncbi:hypothetical protein PV08_05628 [Exophiala spinifera]|uniref:Uncharacterized protein n=1 Tax=Exophiala spinifera TaxID=91928 RepID=A0A0D2BAI3_9EURO|nr:uncharacterized protein PV08_05628 [Exophiala spinifera]KIW15580.1 hypothetical protein PV08_05628 [Exophiala spinifera]
MASVSKAVRRYQAGVERALGLFDASNEWADYISFLSRLGKALQASPPDTDVPFKSQLAKYLALCLKPSLPSGVHQKALEVYNLVFTLLGREGLSRDLSIWLPGISHTLTFASLTTRPLFLALYDDHLLHLPSHVLRPALRATILSLLPGIEEENSEDFDRTFSTINRLRQIFADDNSEAFFWQSLFLASMTSVTKRPGALVYLTKQLPNMGPGMAQVSSLANSNGDPPAEIEPQIKAVTTPEPGLLIRCFATGLQDDQPLVQRGFLDLLVSHLPLNAPLLQHHVSPKDLDVLVTSAMSVVLKRDMSLNRRLWTWFVGREDKREGSTDVAQPLTDDPPSKTNRNVRTSSRHEYFSAYGLDSVVRSLEKLLKKQSLHPIERARPFRIMLSLMDRWVIGKLPVEALFIPAMQDLQQYQRSAPSQTSFDEVFRSANVFFDATEPQLVTSQLFRLLEKRDFELIEFIISNFNLQEEEMVIIHLPMLCLAISEMLAVSTSSPLTDNGHQKPDHVYEQSLSRLLEALISLLPSKTTEVGGETIQEPSGENWMKKLNEVYSNSSSVKKALVDAIEPALADQLLLRNLSLALLQCLRAESRKSLIGSLVNSLTKVISRSSNLEALGRLDLGKKLYESLFSHSKTTTASEYETTRAVTRIMDALFAFDANKKVLANQHLLLLIPALVHRLWEVLLPSTPQFHVEAVEHLWNLRMISGELLLVDSKIMDLMCEQPTISPLADQVARFSTLWMHTRFPHVNAELFSASHRIEEDDVPWAMLRQPVLHVIDKFEVSDRDDPRRLWLNNLPTILPVFRILFSEYASATDKQLSLLGLHRLQKLILFAHMSGTHQRELFGPDGSASMLLDMCIENIANDQNDKETIKMTLSILRILVEKTDIRDAHDLVTLLLRRLVNAEAEDATQEDLLDTLQTIFAKPNLGPPPNELMHILISGISSKKVDSHIDKWITLLRNILPLYTTQYLLANMLKLTACFCQRIKSYFGTIQQLCEKCESSDPVDNDADIAVAKYPERSINNLLSGLEFILARAHTHLSDRPTSSDGSINSSIEIAQSRAGANNRLTVILCMQDTIKLCGDIWAWRILRHSSGAVVDTKSFVYLSSRLRTRTRRLLEHLSDAEPQECLETLMGMWVEGTRRNTEQDATMSLMQSLDGARPKFMMPATFNGIYNRTNPSALDLSQRSSLSVDVTALDLMSFLIAYTKALEDDLLEEIWADCTAFLREVLANPMPHRQILLQLLQFVAVVCQKMENTNFGEVSKMRRELADLCARLFTAIFTIRPTGLDPSLQGAPDSTSGRKGILQSGNAIHILCECLPVIGSTLGDQDKLNNTLTGVAVHITGPALRSKLFPQSVNIDILRLILLMAKSQPTSKIWKKDVLDLFNDAKFFQSPASLADGGWFPLLRQAWLVDKGLMTDLVSKLTAPTTAGLVFGVGAAAARTEADKRTQLILRRIAVLLLAGEIDAFVSEIGQIVLRLEELLTATPSSSPSSATRGDIYLVLRAMVLSFSQMHLVSTWPIVDVELRDLFTNVQSGEESTFTGYSQVQGAKLLDLLLLLKLEEFQPHEWVFVTDTIDAIHPPQDFKSVAIADSLIPQGGKDIELPSVAEDEARRPWLGTELSRTQEDPTSLLRPFFKQLSIHAFEDTYSLEAIDLDACRADLVADLFTD